MPMATAASEKWRVDFKKTRNSEILIWGSIFFEFFFLDVTTMSTDKQRLSGFLSAGCRFQY